MRPLISFMHISLDGFVAGPNGEMNWININPEIFDHVEKRIGETDTALYGRVTFDMMEGYWPTAADKPNASQHDKNHSRWYKQAHKIVMSHSMKYTDRADVTIIGDDLTDRIKAIKAQAGTEILVFGSPSSTHALIQAGLIDGYWLFVNPVILGKGIPLFDGSQGETKLELISSRSFACGVNELNYVAKKTA
jgi:dihydrofolate reductase